SRSASSSVVMSSGLWDDMFLPLLLREGAGAYRYPSSRAAAVSSSRNLGCARLIIDRARSCVDSPLRQAAPYSETTQWTSVRGVVTIAPGLSLGTTRET